MVGVVRMVMTSTRLTATIGTPRGAPLNDVDFLDGTLPTSTAFAVGIADDDVPGVKDAGYPA